MSESTWDLRILDDGLLENTESIAIYIQQPVNAVLGRRRKMRIRLINAEDGNNMNFYKDSKGTDTCILIIYVPA